MNLLIMVPDSLPLLNTSSIDWQRSRGQQQEASLFVLFRRCTTKMDRKEEESLTELALCAAASVRGRAAAARMCPAQSGRMPNV